MWRAVPGEGHGREAPAANTPSSRGMRTSLLKGDPGAGLAPAAPAVMEAVVSDAPRQATRPALASAILPRQDGLALFPSLPFYAMLEWEVSLGLIYYNNPQPGCRVHFRITYRLFQTTLSRFWCALTPPSCKTRL